MTSSQIITFVIELESTSCQPRILQHTLVMARQNSWQVRPDDFWNPVNKLKNYLHKITWLKWVLALHATLVIKGKNPQNIVITYIILTWFNKFSHCPKNSRVIPEHLIYIQHVRIRISLWNFFQNESRLRNPLSFQDT